MHRWSDSEKPYLPHLWPEPGSHRIRNPEEVENLKGAPKAEGRVVRLISARACDAWQSLGSLPHRKRP
jgi:hypothetical protein